MHAKTAIVKGLKDFKHKKLKVSNIGTMIDKEKPFISASPDLVISCLHCPKSLAESKCPFTIKYCSPTIDNQRQLEKIIDAVRLKKSHSPYAQIQGQLGITKFEQCWYFVLTRHGHYIESVL